MLPSLSPKRSMCVAKEGEKPVLTCEKNPQGTTPQCQGMLVLTEVKPILSTIENLNKYPLS